MDAEEMLSFLEKVDIKLCKELEPFERMTYGEFVCAEGPACYEGDMTYGDPDLDMIYDIHKAIINYIDYLNSCMATLASNESPFD